MWFQVGEPLGIYAIGLFDGWDGAHRLEKKKKKFIILKFLDMDMCFTFFFLEVFY